MKRIAIVLGGLCLSTVVASPAHAGEIFGGLDVPDTNPADTKRLGAQDLKISGARRKDRHRCILMSLCAQTGQPITAPSASRQFGDKLYVRPGLGLAVHTGSAGNFQRTDRIAFGSRILFAPELGIGTQLNDRVSVEASWVHMSHAQLFGRQNPGIDNVGVRLNVAF